MMNLQHVDNVVETGFPTMDKILSGGLEKGEVTLVAAAPSVGKSTLALNIFANECEKLAYTPTNPNAKKQLVYYVSLEMTQAQIIERLISMKALKNFRFSDYKEKKYSDSDNERFLHAMGEIEKYPAFINANFKASINDIRNQISQLSNSYDIPFLVIDHLHIMDYDRSNENQEIAQITKNLKAIAKQYQMSILLLSQVNKTKEAFNINNGKSIQKPGFSNVSSDDEHKIGMNDIRGSGAPVQDAAVVMLM
jgi:replicative DNA helicase